jgi:hypothetical protein
MLKTSVYGGKRWGIWGSHSCIDECPSVLGYNNVITQRPRPVQLAATSTGSSLFPTAVLGLLDRVDKGTAVLDQWQCHIPEDVKLR